MIHYCLAGDRIGKRHYATACIRTNTTSPNGVKCHPRGPPLCCNVKAQPLSYCATHTQEQKNKLFLGGCRGRFIGVGQPQLRDSQIQAYFTCIRSPGTPFGQCQAAPLDASMPDRIAILINLRVRQGCGVEVTALSGQNGHGWPEVASAHQLQLENPIVDRMSI